MKLKIRNFTVGIILLSLIALCMHFFAREAFDIFYLFAKSLFKDFLSTGPEFRSTLFVICLTAIISLLSVLFAKYLERKTIILSHLREKKIPVYEKIIDLIFSITFGEKLDEKLLTEEEKIKTFAEITKDITVWGSDEMLLAFHKFREMSIEHFTDADAENSENDFAAVNMVGDLLLAIRKDLGHDNKNISRKTILGLFINDLPNNFK